MQFLELGSGERAQVFIEKNLFSNKGIKHKTKLVTISIFFKQKSNIFQTINEFAIV